MLLPLDFQLHLWRRWLDNVPYSESGLSRNPLAICTWSSDLTDDLDWHMCFLRLARLACKALRRALQETYERAHPWHLPWQSAQSVIRLSIVSPPSWLLRFM